MPQPASLITFARRATNSGTPLPVPQTIMTNEPFRPGPLPGALRFQRARIAVPRVIGHYGTGAGTSAHNEKPAGEPAGLSVLVEEGRQLVRYSQNPSQRLGETLLRGLSLIVGALTAAAVLDQDWDLRSVPVASNERAQGA